MIVVINAGTCTCMFSIRILALSLSLMREHAPVNGMLRIIVVINAGKCSLIHGMPMNEIIINAVT